MKKLLSAVTSIVMSASLLTSAFASTVSAASSKTAVQPNVSLSNFDDIATKNVAASGDLTLDFGEYNVDAGGSVNVDIKLTDGDVAVGGMDVFYQIDSPLTITGFGGTSAAYGASVDTNKEKLEQGFFAVSEGEPVKGEVGASVFKCKVSVPSTTPTGDYKITFKSIEAYKSGQSSESWDVNVIPGVIHVTGTITGSDSQPTPTETVTETTTDYIPSGDSDLTLDFGKYTVDAGSSVSVDVKLAAGDVAVGGMDVFYQIDSPLSITGFGGTSAAYGASVDTNKDKLEQGFFAVSEGEPVKGEVGASVFKCKVSVPADTPSGDYKITFKSVEAYKSGQNSDSWNVKVIPGVITVFGQDTTVSGSGSTTTTTTTEPSGDADLVLDFGKYTGEKGGSVNVDVKLASGDVAVGGMDVFYQIDSPLAITGFGGTSAAYGASVDTNKDKLEQGFFAVSEGEPVKGEVGASVFKCKVSIPADCPDGEYKITFKSVEAYKSGQNSDSWNVKVIPGVIKVGEGTTEVSGSTTTTTTTVPSGDADLTLDFGKYTGEKGGSVSVDVKLAAGDVAVGGMDVFYQIDSPLAITGFGGTSAAYGASVDTNKDKLEQGFFAVSEGEPVKGEVGASVFKCKVSIPADCPDGEYKITFKSVEAYKSGQNSDSWNVKVIPGVITVGTPTSTTSSATATTTTTTVSEIADTTSSTSTSIPPVNGSVEWVIPTVEAEPGQTVKMNVVVKNSDLEIAGATFGIKNDSGIDYVSISDTSEAYGLNMEANNADKIFGFHKVTAKGVKAENGSTVFTITYKVPADCKSGTYNVKWSDAEISDINGNIITSKVKLTDGKIIVGDPLPSGKVSWVLDKKTAKPGETVKINAVVSDKDGVKLPVAGAQFKVDAASPIAYSSISDTSAAYSATVEPNNKDKEFAFANKSGSGVAAADGTTIFTIEYKVPADCASGRYAIKWSDAFVSDTNGRNLTDNVALVDGYIEVVSSEGSVEWVIPEKEAYPGDKVEMAVLVKNSSDPALGVAGAQFNIKNKDGVSYVSATGSTAYNATLEFNNKDKEFGFATADGKNFAAGDNDVVMILNYTVPADCEPGIYDVKWSDAFISDTNGADITSKVKLTDGFIKVLPNGETTTTTTSQTTSSEDTTVTTTSTGVQLPDGAVAWQIDTKDAMPGDTVKLDVVVLDPQKANIAIGGAQFGIKETSPIKLAGYTNTSDAYGATIEGDLTSKEFGFATPTGAGKAAADKAVVLTLEYTVPADCAEGFYPVTFEGDGFAYVSDADGNKLNKNVLFLDGGINVKYTTTTTTGESTTTTSTTSSDASDESETTTTSSATSSVTETESTTSVEIPTGMIAWEIGTKYAEPGDTVQLEVVVLDPNEVKLPVAGAQVLIAPTSPIKTAGYLDSTAYTGKVEGTLNTNEFAFHTPGAVGVAAENGATVFTISYTVPEDCAEGFYPVEFAGNGYAFVSDTNGADITKNVFFINGGIYVTRYTSTSSTEESTTTTTTSSDVTEDTTTSTTDVTSESTTSTDVTSESTTSDVTGESTTSTGVTDESTTSTDVTSESTTTDVTETESTTSESTDVTTSSTTVSETETESTTTIDVPDGMIAWQIDRKDAEPGETVQLNVYVRDPNAAKLAIAGAQVVINPTSPIKTAGYLDTTAYTGVVEGNNTTNEFAFHTPGAVGVAAENNATVFTISYTVPEDCADGFYPVEFAGDGFTFISDTNGADITKNVLFVNGGINVKRPTSTTTTDETTTTTSTDVTDESTTSTDVTSESTTSTDVTSESTTSTDVTDETTTSTDVTGESTTSTDVTDETTTSTDVTGESTTSTDVTDETTTSTDVTGESTTSSSTSDTDTTTVTEIETTTVSIPEGVIAWQIGQKEAKPGDTVTLEVVVVDRQNKVQLPIAGAQVLINPTSPIKTSGYLDTTAYTGTVEGTLNTNEFAFTTPGAVGVAAKDGDVVFTITYTVPEDCADGFYPVVFEDSFTNIRGTDGADLTSHVFFIDGGITVKRPTSTTTTDETTTTTSTDVTDETTTSTDVTSESTTSTDVTGESTTSTDVTGESTTSTDVTGESTTSTDVTGESTTTTDVTGESTTTTDVTDESTTTTDVTSETTTSTTEEESTTTTTTTLHVPDGAIAWAGNEVSGKPGETVTIKFVINNPKDSDVPVSGAKFVVDTPAGFEIKDAAGSDAYKADLQKSGTGYKFTVEGTPINAEDGAVVAEFKITIPEDAEPGNYEIDLTKATITGDGDLDVSKNILIYPGTIKVDVPASKSYAVVDTTYGFYFSHDNGTTRGRGFQTDMIKSFKIYDVDYKGNETERKDLDRSLLNFHGATPANTFKVPTSTKEITLDNFKFEVPVYYGDEQLLDKDGKPVTVTAYIGVKGDADLDGMAVMHDASLVLRYFSAMSGASDAAKAARETQISAGSKIVSSPDAPLDDFCAFLANVTADEYDPDNWKKTKENRQFSANDASAILMYYTVMAEKTLEGEVTDDTKQQEWDRICPYRNKSSKS